MKRFILLLALALSISGCNGTSTTVASVDNALASLAKNSIPAACAIINVAEGYFTTLQADIPPADVAAEQVAVAAVAAICNNPPSDIAGAFAVLLNEWTLIEASTKVAP